MGKNVREYNVHGMRLRVETQGPLLAEAVESVIRPFAVNGLDEADFLITIGYGKAPCQADRRSLRPSWQGIGPAGLETAIYYSQTSIIIELTGLALARIDTFRRRGDITVRPGDESCLNHGCITPMLCEFLHSAGHHVIHAASVAVGDQDEDRVVIVAGNSGAGKTTAALALARAGARLMADDASFIDTRKLPENGHLRVWGLPRPCRVHKRTVELLTWLAEYPHASSYTEEEVLIRITHLPGVDPTRNARPGAILLLEARNDREHVFTSMDKVEMIAELARQNVRTSGPEGLTRARGAFEALTALVERSLCYRLRVGPELDMLYDRIKERMASQAV